MRTYIFLLSLLFSVQLLAQKSPFQEEWTQIDTLELKGQVRSALEIANSIRSKSKAQNKSQEYIKASIFRWRFINKVEEDPENKILLELEAMLPNTNPQEKAVLQVVKANLLSTYLRSVMWNNYNRSSASTDQEDIKTWSNEQLVQAILDCYTKALQDEERLVGIPAGEFSQLLDSGLLNRPYKPSLFDVIAQDAMLFYRKTAYNVSRPSILFTLDDRRLFASPEEFQKLSWKTDDSLVSKVHQVRLLQRIEKIHTKDADPTAFIFAQLERLEFARQYYSGKDKNSLFEEAILKLEEHAVLLSRKRNHKATPVIQLHLAKFYTLAAEFAENKDNPENVYYAKAKEICNQLIKNHSETVIAYKAEQLLVQINAVFLRINMLAHVFPGKANRLAMRYRNLDSLHLKIFKVPYTFNVNQYRYNLESFYERVEEDSTKYDLYKELDLVVPDGADPNAHSVEILMPVLPRGTYAILATNTRLNETRSFAFSSMKVSQFGYTIVESDNEKVYQFYDRETGEFLSNAKIKVTSELKKLNYEGALNALAEYSILKANRRKAYNNTVEITVSKGDDTLSVMEIQGRAYDSYKSPYRHQSKAEIFLDRAIYRPGQTMYFKGVLFQKESREGKTEIVTNEWVKVVIEDVNGEEVMNKKFQTNDFGSFSGTFDLPKGGITGNYNIYTEEADEDSDFWDDVYNHNSNNKYFKVEEYKRPTFEVTYKPFTQAYKPNEEVEVCGNVKAFLGSAITDASGTFTVSRKKVRRYYWYYNDSQEGDFVEEGSFKTDDEGNFVFRFDADFNESQLNDTYEFVINVEVTDLNGETQGGETSLKVAAQNLLTTFKFPEELLVGKAFELQVTNKNLNDDEVSCDNTLKIFKQEKQPGIFYLRKTQIPEFQLISKEDFQRYFPNEPYDSMEIPSSKGALVYEGSFKKQATYEVTIAKKIKWTPGIYILEHIAQGENGTILTQSQEIEILDPSAKYLSGSKLFEYKILNKSVRTDRFVDLQLKTSLKKLPVMLEGYYDGKRFFAQIVNLDGTKVLKIPVDKDFKDRVDFRMRYASFNKYKQENVSVSLRPPPTFLNIETSTFRSKLYPDQKEKWSFKIKDQNNKKAEAEVLASMYDMALDQYATDQWSSNLKFREYSNEGVPYLREINYDNLQAFRFRNREKGPSVLQENFDHFRLFGLALGRSNGAYNRYLNRIRQERFFDSFNEMKMPANVSGIVLDATGLPLPGVNVLVKGTDRGTQTDFDGEYAIWVAPGEILVFSYVGFKTFESQVHDNMYVKLEDDENLEEVIVTAQGIKREKKSLGYSVSTVESEEVLNTLSVADFDQVGLANTNGINVRDVSKSKFKDVKVRSKLNETAFFFPHLTTDKKGVVKFSFDAPQLLSRWKFRMLAHSKDLKAGQIEKLVVTQKDLNVVPNTPRFLREGDVVTLSAKIANLTKKEMQGEAQLQLYDALNMQSIDVALENTNNTKNFNVNAKGNTVVSWELKIPLGTQAVTYRMLAKAGKFSDGEENILPVLTNRMLITETKPFMVRAGEDKTVSMEHLKNITSTTLEHQKFVFEYTSNPSWYALQSMPYLMEFEHECAEQTFSRLFANTLSAEVLNSHPQVKKVFEAWKGSGVLKSPLEKNEELKAILIAETPWLRDAQSETERQKRLGLLFDTEKNAAAQTRALNKLKQVQNNDGSFPWFSGGRGSKYITRHIVEGMGHLKVLGVDLGEEKMLKSAIGYLDAAFIKEMKEYKDRLPKDASIKAMEGFYQRRRHLHYLYTRSFFSNEHPLPQEVKEATDNTLVHYNAAWIEKTIYEQGLLALINHRYGNTDKATPILVSLKEAAVQSEVNGMYWKNNTSGWYWYQAPIETHALLMEAFNEITQDTKTVDELKIWLLQQKRTGDWKTTKATASAIYVLLMTGTPFTELSTTTTLSMVNEEDQRKVNTTAIEAGTGYRKVIWSTDEVDKDVADIRIENKGNTVGFGGLYWQYFEDLDKIEKGEGDVLKLNKELFVVDSKGSDKKPTLIDEATVLNVGQTVRVRLTIKAQSNMEFVHLKDMRASGLEPWDVISEHHYEDRLWYYQSTKDTATHFFFDRLPMGVYIIEYDMKVNNKGTFSNGLSTIQSMYAPGFSGNTAGIKLKVE